MSWEQMDGNGSQAVSNARARWGRSASAALDIIASQNDRPALENHIQSIIKKSKERNHDTLDRLGSLPAEKQLTRKLLEQYGIVNVEMETRGGVFEISKLLNMRV